MSKYQITLTPVDKFFFGGDMTFRVEGQDKAFNEQYSSYIIQSSMFPQQTSLLGTLRFLVLRNAGNGIFSNGIIVNKAEAKKLIGEKSFMVNDNHTPNSFGMIGRLSHVKVRRTEKGKSVDLEFAPLFKDLNFAEATKGLYNQHDIYIPKLSKTDYDAKEGLCLFLTDGTNKYELGSIFKEDRRIGIDRDITTGKTDEGALFKQISYRFNNDKEKDIHYCFVFDAEVDDAVNLNQYSGQMVTIGGDNSQFIIDITKEVNSKSNFTPLANAVCVLSPTFLTRDEAKQAKFAVTRLMPFRFLVSEMEKVDSYHILSKQLTRSNKYELYAPGSVFYFENEDQKNDFTSLIKGKEEFRQIGYNEYK